jgi:hypothetical protein
VELFPLVLDDVEATDTYIGVSVGFAVGFAMVFGLESIIEWIVGSEEDDKKSDIGNENPNAKATEIRSPLLNDGDYINSKSGNSSERSSKDSGSGKMTNFVKTKGIRSTNEQAHTDKNTYRGHHNEDVLIL